MMTAICFGAHASDSPTPLSTPNVAVADAILTITTRREDVSCVYHRSGATSTYAFTSGWLDTFNTLSVRAGLIEVSARLPPPVARVWPAAWAV